MHCCDCGVAREGRQGIDLVKDEVETCLDREVDNIRAIQERMRETLDIANSQLDNNVRKQVQLQEDLDNKDTALDIDKICFQLRNNSKAVLPFVLIVIAVQCRISIKSI